MRRLWLGVPLAIGCAIGDDMGSGVWLGNGASQVTYLGQGTIEGDLNEGEVIDLNWADQSTVACWPGTENDNFTGPHVFYGSYIPRSSKLTATATPAEGVDLSLYVIELLSDEYDVPPNLERCVSCEASYDAISNSNPGEVESTYVTAIDSPYNVLIGIAGAAGHTSGGFSLSVSLEDY